MTEQNCTVTVALGNQMSAAVRFSWSNDQSALPYPPLDLCLRLSEANGCKEYKPPQLPGAWDSNIEEPRLRYVIERVISSDFLLKRRFESGGEIRVRVSPPSLKNTRQETAIRCLGDLSTRSASASNLIRPLLMSEPDVSYLYPYQMRGVAWLKEKRSRLLADDMGLGKTLQTVTAIRQLVRLGTIRMVLVISPKSLVYNWVGEFRKWAPELACVAVNSNPKDAEAVWSCILHQVHVVVTHYEEIRSAATHLRTVDIDLLVADEAHRLRNESAQLSESVRSLRRGRMWALTGTPIERDAVDVATLMSLLEPQRFTPSDSAASPEILRAMVREYVLIRRRADVLKELPAVTERIERLELLPKQRSRYEKALLGVGADGSQLDGTLAVLNELRRICDYDPVSHVSAKVLRVIELLREISEIGEKAIVFSYMREPLRLIASALKCEKGIGEYAFIDGTLNAEDRDAAVRSFRQNKEVSVLLASSKVAGEGLTLIEANHVIFFNQWWNPSNNNQARDRVNRIGQTRPVNVYTFVSEDTVEEYLQDILEHKNEIFWQVIGKLADVSKPLTREEQLIIDEIGTHLRGL